MEEKNKIDFENAFQQNLKYICQTEINPEDIEKQFVKTDTRFFLTIGEIDCPTGKMIVSDPLYYLPKNEYCPTLKEEINPGKYPVEVAICRNEYVGIRMCTARLKIKNTNAIKYTCAIPTDETAVSKSINGVFTGFPVEAGMMSFCDEQVAQEYRTFLNNWHKETLLCSILCGRPGFDKGG